MREEENLEVLRNLALRRGGKYFQTLSSPDSLQPNHNATMPPNASQKIAQEDQIEEKLSAAITKLCTHLRKGKIKEDEIKYAQPESVPCHNVSDIL